MNIEIVETDRVSECLGEREKNNLKRRLKNEAVRFESVHISRKHRNLKKK